MTFETFRRKLRHLKFIKDSSNNFNEKLNALIGYQHSSDSIYVEMLDHIFDFSFDEFVKDLEDSNTCEFIEVENLLDSFVYDSEFGNEECELFVDNSKEAFDLTVWNVYCACIGTLNEEIADSFTSLRAKI